MELPRWVGQAFALTLTLTYWRQLGLAFLLGSFAVATWSDLKRLSAQREFLEIWLAFLAAMLAVDGYDVRFRDGAWQVLAVKWGLIVLFSLFSLERLPLPYRLFRLAPADAAAGRRRQPSHADSRRPVLSERQAAQHADRPIVAARAVLPLHAGREPGDGGRPRRGPALAGDAGRRLCRPVRCAGRRRAAAHPSRGRGGQAGRRQLGGKGAGRARRSAEDGGGGVPAEGLIERRLRRSTPASGRPGIDHSPPALGLTPARSFPP